MGSPQLDWSFANTPDDSGQTGAGPPQTSGPSKSPRRLASRRLLLGLLGIVALLGLGAWLFTRVGLLGIQSQLTAEIAYEDQRARAGDVGAVLALQAPDATAWRDQLSAQVRLGLAAPLPAGDLLPASTPPRLEQVDALGSDLFSVIVTRDYVDSAGHTYAFDLLQRYRNLAPGQWERLPPDTTALSTTTFVQGQRLSITVPIADLPWLRPALLQADDLIVQACIGWAEACPTGLRLVADFGMAQELATPIVTAPRTTSGYARIFDMATALLPDNLPVHSLPAPLLAGRPHDSAAQTALSRSLGVHLLGLFADKVAGWVHANDDYFHDALVARAEVRYFGSDEAPLVQSPKDYVPPNFLWQMSRSPRPEGSWRTDLAWRREAFDFLNFALASQPPSADGKLLRSLRAQSSASLVDDWLAGALGPAASGLADAWTRQTLAEFANHPVADWSRYNGLLMACDEGVFQVRGGVGRRLLPELYQGPNRNMYMDEVSPDGRYVLFNYHGPSPANPTGTLDPWNELDVMDLVTHIQSPVAAASFAMAIGWSSADSLVYWSRPDDIISPAPKSQYDQSGSGNVVQLRTYQPASGAHDLLMPELVFADFIYPTAWSANHSTLVLSLAKAVSGGRFQASLALLTFGNRVQLRPLAPQGDVLALSPDGSHLAYINDPLTPGINRINLLDLATSSVANLAVATDLGLPLDNASFGDLRWSADGRQIAGTAYSNSRVYLFIAPAAAGPAHAWADRSPRQVDMYGFSPDGRYVAASVFDFQGPLKQFWLVDPQATSVQPALVGAAYSITWAPTGHWLIIAGPAGVSAFDPKTGEYEWLGNWQNCQLRW